MQKLTFSHMQVLSVHNISIHALLIRHKHVDFHLLKIFYVMLCYENEFFRSLDCLHGIRFLLIPKTQMH